MIILEVWNIKDDPIPDVEPIGMVNERFLKDSGTDDVKWNFEFVSVKDMTNKSINKKYNNNKDGRNDE